MLALGCGKQLMINPIDFSRYFHVLITSLNRKHHICIMNGMKNLWLVSLLFTFVLLSCGKVKDPEFRRVENFRIKNFGLTDVTIGFRVTYYNPNNFGVTVKEAVADVYMDSVFMGKFVQDSTVNVGRNAEFSIPLSGKISLGTALKMDLRNIGERKISLKANGNVKVGKAGIFVTKPFLYEGLHSLDEISLQQ